MYNTSRTVFCFLILILSLASSWGASHLPKQYVTHRCRLYLKCICISTEEERFSYHTKTYLCSDIIEHWRKGWMWPSEFFWCNLSRKDNKRTVHCREKLWHEIHYCHWFIVVMHYNIPWKTVFISIVFLRKSRLEGYWTCVPYLV